MTSLLTGITHAEIEESIGEISIFTFTAPRDALPDDLESLHDTGFRRQGEGEIFRGYVSKHSTSINSDGVPMTTVEVEGREVELRWASTYSGIIVNNLSPANALTAILAGSGWTGTIEGSGFPALVTKRFDSMTLFEAVSSLTERLGGYVRFDRINRVVTISNTPPASGIGLANPNTPSIGTFGVIDSIEEISSDKSTLYNEIVPQGVSAGNITYNLGRSNRSSPYTRISFVKNRPTIVASLNASVTVLGLPGAGNQQSTRTVVGSLNCSGSNRAIVVAINGRLMGSLDLNPLTCSIGGVEVAPIQTTPFNSERYLNLYILKNAPAGEVSVVVGHNKTDLGNPTVRVAAFALQDVDQILTVTSTSNSGTGTSVSLTLAGAADDLRFGVCSHNADNAATITSASGQNRLITGVAYVADSLSDSGDNTFGWSWSGSRGWAAVALRVRGTHTWYIEDSGSISTYGRRSFPLTEPGDKFVGATSAQLQAAANTLYDYAVSYLQEHKDPARFFAVTSSWVPLAPLDWEVGSTLHVRYSREKNPIDEVLVVPSRTQTFDSEGVRHWQLELSTQNVFRSGLVSLIADFQKKIEAIQNSQV